MFKSTFSGGIHPDENKFLTEKKPFENISVPHICRIPLQQHTGKPALAIVQKGDLVKEGQLIAKADGFVSANVHSSIPGKVIDIAKFPTPFSSKGDCIVIETQGSFNEDNLSKSPDWKEISPADIKKIISDSGIVGLGGAAFPTHVKLSPPENKKIDVLIINAAECEPYLTVDDQLMKSYPSEIIEGIEITLKALSINKAIIGIEENKKESFDVIKKVLSARKGSTVIKVKMLKTKYPQGAEKQLITALTGKQVPSGGLPMDAGAVVQNVGTVYAIQQAVCSNKPLFERYITVSGSLIKNPGNYKVKIGTLLSHIVEECGGLKSDPSKIIMGGPMCGLAISTLDMPVVKGTSGVLFFSKKEVTGGDYDPCIRCGSCVDICPINLVPCDIANSVEKYRYDLAGSMNPLDCIQCGACAFVCPSKRPISHYIKMAQQYMRNKK